MDYQLQIDRVFDLQSQHLENVRKLSIKKRIQLLKKLRNQISAESVAIKEALFLDLRKNETESEATEIFPLLEEIDLHIANLEDWAEEKSVPNNSLFLGSKAKIIYEPKGKVLIISPWNYPFYLPLLHLVSSVSARNVSIVKPSEFTPNVNKVLQQIISDVFVEEHVTIINGSANETTYLIHKKFDHIHFTGSPKVGKLIMAEASKFLTSCTLELGGKSPFIIDDKSNLNFVIDKLLIGKLTNLGQTCIAPDYVLILENRKIEFINLLKKKLNEKLSKINPEKDLVKIINQHNYSRLNNLIKQSIEKGSTIEFRKDSNENELYFSSTIISNLAENDDLLTEEIFGPIIPIVTFDSKENMAEFINFREKPLALYLMSNQKKWIRFFEENTSSGSLVINDVMIQILHPNLPFGGVNNSGIGKSTGQFGFEDFSHQKAVLRTNKFLSGTNFMRIPYSKFSKLLFRFFTRN